MLFFRGLCSCFAILTLSCISLPNSDFNKLPLPFSALPADEWFVETAKSAINKLLLGVSGSETSDIDEDHIIIHDEVVSDSDTVSSLSTMDSTESFASASMAELDSPSNLSDPDN